MAEHRLLERHRFPWLLQTNIPVGRSQVGCHVDRLLRTPNPAMLPGRQACNNSCSQQLCYKFYEVEVLTQKPKMKSTLLFCQVDIFLIIQYLTGMTRLNSHSSSVPLYLLYDCFKLNLTVNEIVNI